MESALSKIIESGILGAMLVVCLIALYFLFKELKAERDARIADLKQYSTEDKKIQFQTNQTLKLILTLLRGGKK